MAIPTIKWVNDSVRIIDQTRLPSEFRYIYCRRLETLIKAIKTMQIRGAPALGIAAAYAVYLGVRRYQGKDSGAQAYQGMSPKSCWPLMPFPLQADKPSEYNRQHRWYQYIKYKR